MDNFLIFGHGNEERIIRRVLGNYDAPAFVRRARRVREAYDHLLAHCRERREQWLPLPRLCLGRLRALAGDWDRLRPILSNDHQVEMLRDLERELSSRLRVSVNPTESTRKLRGALEELRDSLRLFNRRWLNFLATLNLEPVNEAREGYNRYYLLEKECAMRSPRLARQGFQKLAPFTLDEMTTLFPVLEIPELK
ncbi:MAG TPA: hypothetical protein VGX70_19690 [Gemmataceae bacterium]|nr:hypothetical protein [Gemmataceae bacterium]